MEQWISASEGFIQADVIRWTEGIYEQRRNKKAKARRLGERQVTAEVTEATRDGWVKLLVRACLITKDEYAGKTLVPLKAGETIKRARKTIERGALERLLWSDETARASVLRSYVEAEPAERPPIRPRSPSGNTRRNGGRRPRR